MNTLILSNTCARAEIVPAEGARIQHLHDLSSSRELLHQQGSAAMPWPRNDFMTGCPGGWDEMFPNDTPWGGHPDHGRIWATPFHVLAHDGGGARLRARLTEPGVTVERRFSLLPPPRRGLRVETELRAELPTGPFLWASHPMLAVRPGWIVEIETADFVADIEAPGRFAAGAHVNAVPPVPGPGEGWSEVLYTFGVAEASVASPDGRSRTRVAWNTDFLRYLWVVTVTGAFGVDLCLLFEPCTTKPYRLEDAIAAGAAERLVGGESRSWWTEIESLDPIPDGQ